MKRKNIEDFDEKYLSNLLINLLPLLRERSGWVSVVDIAEDADLFVDAVAFLGGRGFFDDAAGNIRIEFGKDNARIRYIDDREIAMCYPDKKCKRKKYGK